MRGLITDLALILLMIALGYIAGYSHGYKQASYDLQQYTEQVATYYLMAKTYQEQLVELATQLQEMKDIIDELENPGDKFSVLIRRIPSIFY